MMVALFFKFYFLNSTWRNREFGDTGYSRVMKLLILEMGQAVRTWKHTGKNICRISHLQLGAELFSMNTFTTGRTCLALEMQ